MDGDIERADSRDREDDVTQSRSSAGASAGGTAGAASSGGRAVERKGLQKYVNVPSDIPAAAASSGGNGASGASFAGIAVAGSAYEQQQQQSQPPNGGAGPPAGAALNSKGGSGLAALARAGKLFNTQSIFDLEVRWELNPNGLPFHLFCSPFFPTAIIQNFSHNFCFHLRCR